MLTVGILVFLFFQGLIAYALCKSFSRSDKMAESVKLRNPISRGQCDGQCHNCEMENLLQSEKMRITLRTNPG